MNRRTTPPLRSVALLFFLLFGLVQILLVDAGSLSAAVALLSLIHI